MALDAVIFDVDGTLIDSNALHVRAFVRAFANHGYTIPADRITIEIGKGGDQLVPSILGPAADRKDGEAIREDQPKEFEKLAQREGLSVFPKVRELLAAVRERKLKIVMATSSGKSQLAVLKKYSGLDVAVEADTITNADDIEQSKPAPDLVAAAVAKARLSPAQCVMIGDTPYDAQSAKGAGVVTFGVRCGGNGMSDEDLRRAGARRTYADPADLLANLDAALVAASPGSAHLTNAVMEKLMAPALAAAEAAMDGGEVPIGAALCRGDGTVVASGFNRLNATRNKTAHAEMVAFAAVAGTVRLDAPDLILVSTLEPCVMCLGAAMEAAVDTVIYGLAAPADGGTQRVTPPTSPDTIMPRIVGGVLAERSVALLKRWYAGHTTAEQARYVRQLLELHGQLA